MNNNSLGSQFIQEQPEKKGKPSDVIWGLLIGIAMSVFFYVLLGYMEATFLYWIFSIILLIVIILFIILKRYFLLLGIAIIIVLLLIFFFVLWPMFANFVSG